MIPGRRSGRRLHVVSGQNAGSTREHVSEAERLLQNRRKSEMRETRLHVPAG